MKCILLDLYHGNYSAIGKKIPRDSEYARALHIMCEMEEEMNACINDDQGAVFKRYLDAEAEFISAGSEMYFIEGCRVGARLMLEMTSETRNE